jgi:hypothetical protein
VILGFLLVTPLKPVVAASRVSPYEMHCWIAVTTDYSQDVKNRANAYGEATSHPKGGPPFFIFYNIGYIEPDIIIM